MSAWILRFPRHEASVGGFRLVLVFHVTADGEETELEVLELSVSFGVRDLVIGQVAKGRRRLILDFSFIDRLDSSGIGEMVSVLGVARDLDGELVLSNLNPRLQEIFRITMVDRLIPVFASIGEAVDHFNRFPD